MKKDINILKQFTSILNRTAWSEEAFNNVLKIWDLNGIDLDKEMEKISQKKSNLSKSQRDAVPEFIKIRNAMVERAQQAKLNAPQEKNLSEDTLVI